MNKEFEEEDMNKNFDNELNDELKDFAPFLADLKKQRKDDPFKTPKFYFDTLADKVMEKAQPSLAEAHPNHKVGRLSISPNLKPQNGFSERWAALWSALWQPRLAVAFSVCLLVAVGAWVWLRPQNTLVEVTPSVVLTDLNKEDVREYVKENIEDFDDELILESKIDYVSTEKAAPSKVEDKAAIEDFLKENLDEEDLNDLQDLEILD